MSVININNNNFQDEVMHSEKLVLLDLWSRGFEPGQARPAGFLGKLVRPLPDGQSYRGRNCRRAQ